MGCGACMGQGTEASGPVPIQAKIAQRAQGVSREAAMGFYFRTVEGVVVEMFDGKKARRLVWDPAQCRSVRGS
jgi:hypothetical protein